MEKSRAKRKGKAVSVRFDTDFFEKLKKERGVKTAQQAVDFFQKWYEQTFHPIAGNPVFDKNVERQRNAIAETKDVRQYPFTAKDVVPQKNVPRETKMDLSVIEDDKQTTDLVKELLPPPGLKGIELTMWKAQQRDRENEAKNDK